MKIVLLIDERNAGLPLGNVLCTSLLGRQRWDERAMCGAEYLHLHRVQAAAATSSLDIILELYTTILHAKSARWKMNVKKLKLGGTVRAL